MTNIWDSHIHLFTEEMSTHPESWADDHQEPVWKACVAPPDRPSIQGWASVDQLLSDMDDANIERVILQGWYWENHETCQLHNHFYATLIEKYPDRLLAFATIQPTAGAKALEELTLAREHGFSGLGEIHPQAQGFSLSDPCWQIVLEYVQTWDFPINLHVTDPSTKDHPGKIDTPLQDYIDMAKDWPNQVFILAHLGGLLPLRSETGLQVRELKNVYYDCAATPLLYESGMIQKIAETVGTGKLLYGSDYPLRVFPRLQQQPEFKRSIQYLKESGLNNDQLTRILSTNAQELFIP